MADWKKTVDAELDALRAREVALKKARDAKRERARGRRLLAGAVVYHRHHEGLPERYPQRQGVTT